jgi:hypothetical protein
MRRGEGTACIDDSYPWHIWYNPLMEHLMESTILDKMLEPVARCWTPAVAQQIAELRAEPPIQARIDELAAKCNEGALTEAEQREYEAYVEALDLIGLLQAKARAILARLPQC